MRRRARGSRLAGRLAGVAAAACLVAASAAPSQGAAAMDPAAAAGDAPVLRRANAALRAWIAAIDADAPFLLLDREAGRLLLHHGGALLRDCRVLSDSVQAELPVAQILVRHIRRYRRASPYREPEAGPFDWEQYLAAAAPADAALYFDGGLLLYACSSWGRPRPPWARLAAGDLRALYDALPDSTALVVLPRGWRAADAAPATAAPGRGR